jgi:hypothetical protein
MDNLDDLYLYDSITNKTDHNNNKTLGQDKLYFCIIFFFFYFFIYFFILYYKKCFKFLRKYFQKKNIQKKYDIQIV